MKGILLIAEDPSIRDSFTSMLESVYCIYQAQSANEGIGLLREKQGIVAVLAELALARKNGFAFAGYMQEVSHFSLIPIIAITDELPTPEDSNCIDHGYYDLITAYAPQKLVHQRISNAIRARDSLSLSELERMMKSLPACVFLKDTEGKYVFSTQYWNHLNVDDDEEWTIRGKTDLDIRKDKQNARKAMEADKRILETGEGTEYIIEENTDGIREYLQLIKRPVYDDNGKISGIIALINNVTDHQLLKLELEKRANTDALTTLLNKNAARELIELLLSKGEEGAILIMDVDHFKSVNDTYGHAEGDRVLAEIGRTIANSCRSMDVAGRIGGDEFLVFMRGTGAAVQLAKRVQNAIKDVTLSVGIARCPEHGKDYRTLFQAADSALYKVKKNGRGSVLLAPLA